MRRASDWLVRTQVQAAANWLVLPRPHVVVTLPSAGPVVEGIPRTSLTFNRSDLQSAFPEADTDAVMALEGTLLDASDLVVYVSHELMAHDRARVGARGRFLDHGVDSTLFSRVAPSEIPEDMASIAGPRIGFFGGLDDYVIDFDLLETLARRLPERVAGPDRRGNLFDGATRVPAERPLAGHAPLRVDPRVRQRVRRRTRCHGWKTSGSGSATPSSSRSTSASVYPWSRLPSRSWSASRMWFASPGPMRSSCEAVEACLRSPLDAQAQRYRRERVAGDTWDSKAQELLTMLDEIAGVPPGHHSDTGPGTFAMDSDVVG